MDAPGNGNIALPTPRNLGISRQFAVLAALGGVLFAVTAIVGIAIAYGKLDGPAVAAIVVTLGSAVTTLISALKATEAADTAAKAYRTASLTASQTATLQQTLAFHASDACPRPDCPMKGGTAA